MDLFIYQTVSADNKFSEILSTDGILHKLRPDCKTVNIVNIYFDGYFPQRTENKSPILKEVHQSGLFPFGDKYVDNMLRKNYSAEKIISIISKEDFISETEIRNGVENSLDELKNRETTVDVKISDYIEMHYKEEQLFYSPNHPCEQLMKVYIDRILEVLGYEPEEISDADRILNFGTLKGQDIPIYPAVKKVLGLRKSERKYYPNRYLCEELLLDFRAFMIGYIESIT